MRFESDILELISNQEKDLREGIQINLGLHNGEAECMILNSSSPNLAILGGPGSGKSKTLDFIIQSLISKYNEDELELVIKGEDFASYSPYTTPHVKLSTDSDFDRILHYLESCFKDRISMLSRLGLPNFDMIYNTPQSETRRVIVILDDVQQLTEDREDFLRLLRLLRNGRSLGVYFIVSSNVLRHGLSSFISRKVMVGCSVESYTEMFGSNPKHVLPDHGYVYIKKGNSVDEYQVPLLKRKVM